MASAFCEKIGADQLVLTHFSQRYRDTTDSCKVKCILPLLPFPSLSPPLAPPLALSHPAIISNWVITLSNA